MSSSPFTDWLFGEDTSEQRRKEHERQQKELDNLFGKAKVNPERVLKRQDWDLVLPIADKFFPQFGRMLSIMLDLDDLQRKERITIRDLANVARKQGLEEWTKQKINRAVERVATDYLERSRQRSASLPRPASLPGSGKKISKNIRMKAKGLRHPALKAAKSVDIPLKGKFPNLLAEPNAAVKGEGMKKKKKKKGGCMCQKGKGQNGLAGRPETNPKPMEYVIPVRPPNASTTKGDDRGAMSGWAPNNLPNAGGMGVPAF